MLAWEHPFDEALYEQKVGGSYQLAQSLFAQADGGLLGTGFDQSLLKLIPIPESDMIYAVITNELGLAGAAALLLTYLLFVARGLKIAMLARDSFSKLLATGLAFIVAMQVFVIVGGVTRVIPLTGVTLPFVAYGGSSVAMNFVLLALLLVISDQARRAGLAVVLRSSARACARTRSAVGAGPPCPATAARLRRARRRARSPTCATSFCARCAGTSS